MRRLVRSITRSIPTITARRVQVIPAAADKGCMQDEEPRPARSARRRRWGKVLLYVGLGFMAPGTPKLLTEGAIVNAMAIGLLLVLFGAGMLRPDRESPVLPPPPPPE